MKSEINSIFNFSSQPSALVGAMIVFVFLVVPVGMSLADDATDASKSPTVEPRGVMQKAEDTSITFRVSNLIEHNKEVSDGAEVNVTTVNAIVLLTGAVKSAQDKQWCEDTAKSHPKVLKVINELKVRKMRNVVALAKDKALQASVKVRMIRALDENSPNVYVVVYDKTVYLMGVVSQAIAEEATEVARGTRSVDRVITIFQFKEEDGESIVGEDGAPAVEQQQ